MRMQVFFTLMHPCSAFTGAARCSLPAWLHLVQLDFLCPCPQKHTGTTHVSQSGTLQVILCSWDHLTPGGTRAPPPAPSTAFAFHHARITALVEACGPSRLLVSFDASGALAVWESDAGLCVHSAQLPDHLAYDTVAAAYVDAAGAQATTSATGCARGIMLGMCKASISSKNYLQAGSPVATCLDHTICAMVLSCSCLHEYWDAAITHHASAGSVAICASKRQNAADTAADAWPAAQNGASPQAGQTVSGGPGTTTEATKAKAYKPAARSEDPSDKFARLMGHAAPAEHDEHVPDFTTSDPHQAASRTGTRLHVLTLDLQTLELIEAPAPAGAVPLIACRPEGDAVREVPLCVSALWQEQPRSGAAGKQPAEAAVAVVSNTGHLLLFGAACHKVCQLSLLATSCKCVSTVASRSAHTVVTVTVRQHLMDPQGSLDKRCHSGTRAGAPQRASEQPAAGLHCCFSLRRKQRCSPAER
jgi:hypothetical protein